MRKASRDAALNVMTSEATMSRRTWIEAAGALVGIALMGRTVEAQKSPLPAVTVYRSPTCGCCGKWSQRMEKHGFKVTEKNLDDVTSKKRELGVPEAMFSCHTAVVGAYLFEGHVPPDLVEKVVREKPGFLGLAVPGMPQSAPGMDIGHTPYEVLAFRRDGRSHFYAKRSS